MSIGGYSNSGGYGSGSFSRLASDLERAAVSFGSMASAAAFFKTSITTFSKLQDDLLKTNAVAGGTVETFKEMEKATRSMSLAVRTTSVEAANALYFLASAGFDFKESLAALNSIALLAEATLAPLAQVADVVASSLQSFGLEASDSSRVANVFTASILKSQASLDKLAYAMRQVGPVAKAAGLGIEQTSAALNILFNAGLRGEQAGTALRNSIMELTAPTARAGKMLRELGLSSAAASGGFENMVREIAKSNLTLGQVEVLVGKEASAGFLTLLQSMQPITDEAGNVTTAYDQMQKSITGTNAAFETAMKQNQSFAAQMALLRNNVTDLSVTFGASLAPMLGNMAQSITGVVNSFNRLDEDTRNYLATYTAMATAMAAGAYALKFGFTSLVIPAVLGTVKAVEMLAKGIALVRVAMAATAISTGAVLFGSWVIAIAAVGAAFIALDSVIERYSRSITGNLDGINIGPVKEFSSQFEKEVNALEQLYNTENKNMTDYLQAQSSLLKSGNAYYKGAVEERRLLQLRLAKLQADPNSPLKSTRDMAKDSPTLAGFTALAQFATDPAVRKELSQIDSLRDRMQEYTDQINELAEMQKAIADAYANTSADFIKSLASNRVAITSLLSNETKATGNELRKQQDILMAGVQKLMDSGTLAKIEDTVRKKKITKEQGAARVREELIKADASLTTALKSAADMKAQFVSQDLSYLQTIFLKNERDRLDYLETIADISGDYTQAYADKLVGMAKNRSTIVADAITAMYEELSKNNAFSDFTGAADVNGVRVQDSARLMELFSNTDYLQTIADAAFKESGGDVTKTKKAVLDNLLNSIGEIFDGRETKDQRTKLEAMAKGLVDSIIDPFSKSTADYLKEALQQMGADLARNTAAKNAVSDYVLKSIELAIKASTDSYDYSEVSQLLKDKSAELLSKARRDILEQVATSGLSDEVRGLRERLNKNLAEAVDNPKKTQELRQGYLAAVQQSKEYTAAYMQRVAEITTEASSATREAQQADVEFMATRQQTAAQQIQSMAETNARYIEAMFPQNEAAMYEAALRSAEAQHNASVVAAKAQLDTTIAAIPNPDSARGQQLVQEAQDNYSIALEIADNTYKVVAAQQEIVLAQNYDSLNYMLNEMVGAAADGMQRIDLVMAGIRSSSTDAITRLTKANLDATLTSLDNQIIEIERALLTYETAIAQQRDAMSSEDAAQADVAFRRYKRISEDQIAMLENQKQAEMQLYEAGVTAHETYIDVLERELALSARIGKAQDSFFGGFGDAARQAALDAQTVFYDLGNDLYATMSDRLSSGVADGLTGVRVDWNNLLEDMAKDWIRSGISSLIKSSLAGAFTQGSAGFGLGNAPAGGAGGATGALGSASGIGSIFSGLSALSSSSLLTDSMIGSLNTFGQNYLGFDLLAENGLGDTVGGMATMGNLVGGLAGNYLGGRVFGDSRYGSIGGTIGGIAGSYFGPLGSAAGAFLGNGIGSIFGPGESDKTAAGEFNLNTGMSRLSDLGKKTSQENKDLRESVATYAEDLLSQMIGETNKYVSSNLQLIVGNRDGLRYNLNNTGQVNTGTNVAQFFSNLSVDIVKMFDDTAAGQQRLSDLQTAIANINFTDTTQALADIKFALNFSDVGTEEDITDAKRALNELSDTFNEAAATAERLGLSVEYVRQKQSEAETQLREDFLKGYGDSLVNLLSSSVGGITGIVDEYSVALKNAADLNVDTTVVRLFYEEKLRQAIEDANAAEGQRVAALQESAKEAENWQSKWKSISDGLLSTMDKLKVSSASPLSPLEKYQEAKAQFESAFRTATSGDGQAAIDAASSLDGLQSTFLSLSKEYFASSAQYASDYEQVQTYLSQAQTFATRQVDRQQATIDAITAQTKVIQEGTASLVASITASMLSSGGSVAVDYAAGGAGKVMRSNGSWSGYLSTGNFNYKLTEGIKSGVFTEEQAAMLKQINQMLFPNIVPGNGAYDRAFEENPAKNLQAILLARQYGIPGFARGGITPVNRPFIVGENGPELMMAGKHHTVIPMNNSNTLNDTFNEYRKQSAMETQALVASISSLNNKVSELSAALERVARK